MRRRQLLRPPQSPWGRGQSGALPGSPSVSQANPPMRGQQRRRRLTPGGFGAPPQNPFGAGATTPTGAWQQSQGFQNFQVPPGGGILTDVMGPNMTGMMGPNMPLVPGGPTPKGPAAPRTMQDLISQLGGPGGLLAGNRAPPPALQTFPTTQPTQPPPPKVTDVYRPPGSADPNLPSPGDTSVPPPTAPPTNLFPEIPGTQPGLGQIPVDLRKPEGEQYPGIGTPAIPPAPGTPEQGPAPNPFPGPDVTGQQVPQGPPPGGMNFDFQANLPGLMGPGGQLRQFNIPGASSTLGADAFSGAREAAEHFAGRQLAKVRNQFGLAGADLSSMNALAQGQAIGDLGAALGGKLGELGLQRDLGVLGAQGQQAAINAQMAQAAARGQTAQQNAAMNALQREGQSQRQAQLQMLQLGLQGLSQLGGVGREIQPGLQASDPTTFLLSLLAPAGGFVSSMPTQWSRGGGFQIL